MNGGDTDRGSPRSVKNPVTNEAIRECNDKLHEGLDELPEAEIHDLLRAAGQFYHDFGSDSSLADESNWAETGPPTCPEFLVLHPPEPEPAANPLSSAWKGTGPSTSQVRESPEKGRKTLEEDQEEDTAQQIAAVAVHTLNVVDMKPVRDTQQDFEENSALEADAKEVEDKIRHHPCLRLANNPYYLAFSNLVVVVNAATMGVFTDFDLEDLEGTLEYTFQAIYTFEITTRVWGHQTAFFYDSFNIFELVVVAVGCVDLFVLPIVLKTAPRIGGLISILRLLRIIRVVRVFRVVKMFSTLQLLTSCLLRSRHTMTWSMFLILVATLVAAVLLRKFFNQGIEDGVDREVELLAAQRSGLDPYFSFEEYYGSMPKTMFTLFQMLTLEGWLSLIIRPSTFPERFRGPIVVTTAYIFVGFTTYGIISLMRGNFVNRAVETAQDLGSARLKARNEDRADAEAVLKQIFIRADANGDGKITYDEFLREVLSERGIEDFAIRLEISLRDLHELWCVIDEDGSGSLNADEFIEGCLRLRGSAKALDLVTLWHSDQALKKQHEEFAVRFKELAQCVSDIVDSMEVCMGEVCEESAPTLKVPDSHAKPMPPMPGKYIPQPKPVRMPQRMVQSDKLSKKQSVWDRIKGMEDLPICLIIAENLYFQAFVNFLVACNAGMIAVTLDIKGGNLDFISEVFFTVVFSIELGIRVWGHKYYFFVDEETGTPHGFNLFEFLVVAAAVVDMVLTIAQPEGGGSSFAGALSVLRILRLSRLSRVLKLFRSLKELRHLMMGLANTFRIIVWAIAFLVVVLYVFAVLITRLMQDTTLEPVDEPVDVEFGIDSHFGNIRDTMMTLVQCITLDRWAEGISRQLVRRNSPIQLQIRGLLMLVLVCMTYGLLNLVTGAFVLETLQIAKTDAIEIYRHKDFERKMVYKHLRMLFFDADVDKSGVITRAEFMVMLRNPSLVADFEVLGISVAQAGELWDIIDQDCSGTIAAAEFITGCLKVRGAARAVDINPLKKNDAAILEQLDHSEDAFRKFDTWMTDRTTRMQHVMTALSTGVHHAVKLWRRRERDAGEYAMELARRAGRARRKQMQSKGGDNSMRGKRHLVLSHDPKNERDHKITEPELGVRIMQLDTMKNGENLTQAVAAFKRTGVASVATVGATYLTDLGKQDKRVAVLKDAQVDDIFISAPTTQPVSRLGK